MRALGQGMSGDDVKQWQEFLHQQGLFRGKVTNAFDDETLQATIDFQRLHELLPADGVANNRTVGMAMLLGLQVIPEPEVKKEGGE